jgi:primosomal protein N' (replication factor Y)
MPSVVLLARIAVPVPLGQAFTYSVPENLSRDVRRGARVLVDFGHRRVLGVVLDVADREPDVPLEKLKAVRAIVDREPVLDDELLSFLQELARYYVAPLGEVIRLALPVLERTQQAQLEQGGFDFKASNTVGRLVQTAELVDGAAWPENVRGQALEILEHLKEAGSETLAELEERWGNARAALKRLSELRVVRVERRQRDHDPFFAPIQPDTPPELNPAQQAAVGALTRSLDAGDRRSFLLHGVTASGKTEVYLRASAHCLELGGAAIVLVPEIALTPQLVSRFRARLGDAIAVLHSGLTDLERHAMWKRLRSGELRIAIGPRSALFAPVKNLKLICVDEEHDGSFKQEEGVRYHARDMALLRAHRAGALAVLGSATPSLESEMLARSDKLQRLSLPERAHKKALMPDVEIVDLRRIGPGPSGDRRLSVRLHKALEQVLAEKQQAILFLNRRGFAPNLVCEDCGHIAECPSCSVALTLHRSRGEQLVCHYCGYTRRVDTQCSECKGPRLELEGVGTERVETLLGQSFPNARIARLDRDVASGAKSEKILSRMRAGEIDVLVGTQMVTKGHDLPSVTLVGVLNADAALGMPDFRAAERTFQLLVQVAGRAGRGDAPGRVLIQTRNPEHPAVLFAARHALNDFWDQELKDRKELGYPPFARLALVRVDAEEEDRARLEAERFAKLCRGVSADVAVLGPSAAPLARLRNRYRFQFMLRSRDRTALRNAVLAVARTKPDGKVRVSADVDPVSML